MFNMFKIRGIMNKLSVNLRNVTDKILGVDDIQDIIHIYISDELNEKELSKIPDFFEGFKVKIILIK